MLFCCSCKQQRGKDTNNATETQMQTHTHSIYIRPHKGGENIDTNRTIPHRHTASESFYRNSQTHRRNLFTNFWNFVFYLRNFLRRSLTFFPFFDKMQLHQFSSDLQTFLILLSPHIKALKSEHRKCELFNIFIFVCQKTEDFVFFQFSESETWKRLIY